LQSSLSNALFKETTMAEAVLQGPSGGPAIDSATGQPLTMEELLRRRGIMAYKGVVSPLNQMTGAATGADPATAVPTSEVGAALAGAPATVLTNGAPVGGMSAAPGATLAAVSGESAAAGAANLAGVPGEDELDAMSDSQIGDLSDWLTGLGLAGGAAALGAYLLRRKSKGTNLGGVAETVAAANDTTVPKAQPMLAAPARGDGIVDGEFSVVDERRIAAPATRDQAVNPRTTSRSGGPARLNGAAPVTETARALNGRRSAPSLELPNYAAPGRPATRQELGARQSVQSRVLPDGKGVITNVDEFGSLPENMKEEAMLRTEQIIAERRRGREAQRRGQGVKRGVRNAAGPTADIDPETVLQEVSRALKARGTVNALRRVRP
jgi:hypothetical protein